jgi:hypothetical protein
MTELTLPKLTKTAPAAAPRKNKKDQSVLDTAAFLRHVRSIYNMVPVVAIQGRRHEDSLHAKAKDGRHLVAASRQDGISFLLLNSHFKDRRAHLGVGVQREGSFLIGPSMALQRWRGYEEPVKLMSSQLSEVSKAVKCFHHMILSDSKISQIAKNMSRRGYMVTVESRPAAKALIDGLSSSKAIDVGFHIIERMRTGNLEAVDGGRRIKRVRRPDGLFCAGLVCFDLLLSLAKSEGLLPQELDFGAVKERLIRP